MSNYFSVIFLAPQRAVTYTIYKKIRSYHVKEQDNQMLDIRYEDEALLVVNKPPGILIHPTTTEDENSLATLIKNYYHAGEQMLIPSINENLNYSALLALEEE